MFTDSTTLFSCGSDEIMEAILTTVKKVLDFIFDKITLVVILIIR